MGTVGMVGQGGGNVEGFMVMIDEWNGWSSLYGYLT